jgi:4-hydroxybenzoate polyprenyltransferase
MADKSRVRKHRRRLSSGKRVNVRSHTRTNTWRGAKKAWIATGIGGVTTLALLLEAGFALISGIAIVITALCGLLAWWIQQKAADKRNPTPTKRRRTKASRSRSSFKSRSRR